MCVCPICSFKMVDGERGAYFHHSGSPAAAAPASALQGKDTHIHQHTGPSAALLPTQSYLAIKLNFSLHLLKMVRGRVSSYLSPSLSPQIAPVEIDESYDEMKQDARTCLSLMSQGLLYPEHIPLVLAALEEVTHTPHPHIPPACCCCYCPGCCLTKNNLCYFNILAL